MARTGKPRRERLGGILLAVAGSSGVAMWLLGFDSGGVPMTVASGVLLLVVVVWLIGVL